MTKKKKLDEVLDSLNDKKIYTPKFDAKVTVELDTGFINLLQNLLLSTLHGVDSEVLVNAYKKIDERIVKYSKEMEKDEKDREFKPEDYPPLNQLETDIHTITALITNIKSSCFEQDLMVEQEPLDPKEISPLLEAFEKDDPTEYNQELQKMAEKFAAKMSS